MSDCTIWGGRLRESDGRPMFNRDYVYRFALMLKLNRPLRTGYVVDHKCGNPSCVNPDHLQEVTQSEHLQLEIARGRVAPGDMNVGQRTKTHCPAGHEYTPANTYVYLRKRSTKNGGGYERHCKTCRNDRKAQRRGLSR